MLTIFNLHAKVEDREILRGVNLKVNAGEVHAIMGPNGSGKSTLAAVLAGRPGYEVTEGDVHYLGKDLLELDPEERARLGTAAAKVVRERHDASIYAGVYRTLLRGLLDAPTGLPRDLLAP